MIRLRPGVEGAIDQLAGAGGRGRQRVVALGAAGERRARWPAPSR